VTEETRCASGSLPVSLISTVSPSAGHGARGEGRGGSVALRLCRGGVPFYLQDADVTGHGRVRAGCVSDGQDPMVDVGRVAPLVHELHTVVPIRFAVVVLTDPGDRAGGTVRQGHGGRAVAVDAVGHEPCAGAVVIDSGAYLIR
jgi:hypothetical protein